MKKTLIVFNEFVEKTLFAYILKVSIVMSLIAALFFLLMNTMGK